MKEKERDACDTEMLYSAPKVQLSQIGALQFVQILLCYC